MPWLDNTVECQPVVREQSMFNDTMDTATATQEETTIISCKLDDANIELYVLKEDKNQIAIELATEAQTPNDAKNQLTQV